MQNDPIQLMFDEHDIIMKTEPIIKELQGYWNVNSTGYVDTVSQLLDFFMNYADGYHHYKEEEVLFPAISSHPDFKLHEIIDEFNDHHEMFRSYANDIRESLANEEFPESYATLRQYSNDLLDHIAAENDELFVLARHLLTQQELETIYFKFKDADLHLGEERKAEFEALPQRIIADLNLQVE